MPNPIVSVIMPTYEHERFIARAIDSLLAQSFDDWELIVVDDASPDGTHEAIEPLLRDERIAYLLLSENVGYTDAINVALSRARGKYIAYLPSDDVLYREHLESLVRTLDAEAEAVAAYSGVRHHYNRSVPGQMEGYSLQLVQVMHRNVEEKWVSRKEFVSDDLATLYWNTLRKHGHFVATRAVTCEWVDHPDQLHKIIREPIGGINTYRSKFRVKHPLRFRTTVGNAIDEVAQYAEYRSRAIPPNPEGLKILLVGELAYNADRVLALAERGHRLYGLWMPGTKGSMSDAGNPLPYWYNTVGPLPFGHVDDLDRENWQSELDRIKPDVIYGLLNWQAVPFAAEVLRHVRTKQGERPAFVWHFKEGPFICIEKGTWNDLVDLYRYSDGQIYTSPEMREWLYTVIPDLRDMTHFLDFDGDLPKQEWFKHERSPRLSEKDGEIHTVVPGRPIGLHPQNIEALAQEGVHVHFYGDFTHGQWKEWIEKSRLLAPRHLHLHSNVDQCDWVKEFSQYDAGWLHSFQSQNHGDIRMANWDDLNYPARMATLAVAGLPMIQFDNAGSIVATQSLIKRLDAGIFYRDEADLAAKLRDRTRMQALQATVWMKRREFCFDHHADRLIEFFNAVIAGQKANSQPEPLPQQPSLGSPKRVEMTPATSRSAQRVTTGTSIR